MAPFFKLGLVRGAPGAVPAPEQQPPPPPQPPPSAPPTQLPSIVPAAISAPEDVPPSPGVGFAGFSSLKSLRDPNKLPSCRARTPNFSPSRASRRYSRAELVARRRSQRQTVFNSKFSLNKKVLLMTDLYGEEIKVAWELSVMVELGLILCYIPLKAALEPRHVSSPGWLLFFEVLQLVDLCVTIALVPTQDLDAAPLRTDAIADASVEVPGLLSAEMTRVYLSSPHFVLDAIGALAPIVGDALGAYGARAGSTSSVVIALRLLAFSRAPRLLRAHEYVTKYTEFFNTHDYLLKFAVVLLVYALSAHFSACAFIALIARGWMEVDELVARCPTGGMPLSESGECYADTLFWAIGIFTMWGYPSSYTPTTTAEKLLSIGMITTGAMINALIFGTIANYVQQVSRDANLRTTVLDDMNDFLADNAHRLPYDLQHTLRLHTFYMHKNKSLANNDMLALMPYSVRQDVAYAMHHELLESVAQFGLLRPIAIAQLALHLVTANYMPGDSVMTQGESQEDPQLFFVQEGVCAAIKMVTASEAINMPDAVVTEQMEHWNIGRTRIPTARARLEAKSATRSGPVKAQKAGGSGLAGLSRRSSLVRAQLAAGGRNAPAVGRRRATSAAEGRDKLRPVFVAMMGRGEHFGEISVLLGVPRTVTVQAISRCVLLALHSSDFLRILDDSPETLREMIALTHQRLKPRQRWQDNMGKLSSLKAAVSGFSAGAASAAERRGGADGGGCERGSGEAGLAAVEFLTRSAPPRGVTLPQTARAAGARNKQVHPVQPPLPPPPADAASGGATAPGAADVCASARAPPTRSPLAAKIFGAAIGGTRGALPSPAHVRPGTTFRRGALRRANSSADAQRAGCAGCAPAGAERLSSGTAPRSTMCTPRIHIKPTDESDARDETPLPPSASGERASQPAAAAATPAVSDGSLARGMHARQRLLRVSVGTNRPEVPVLALSRSDGGDDGDAPASDECSDGRSSDARGHVTTLAAIAGTQRLSDASSNGDGCESSGRESGSTDERNDGVGGARATLALRARAVSTASSAAARAEAGDEVSPLNDGDGAFGRGRGDGELHDSVDERYMAAVETRAMLIARELVRTRPALANRPLHDELLEAARSPYRPACGAAHDGVAQLMHAPQTPLRSPSTAASSARSASRWGAGALAAPTDPVQRRVGSRDVPSIEVARAAHGGLVASRQNSKLSLLLRSPVRGAGRRSDEYNTGQWTARSAADDEALLSQEMDAVRSALMADDPELRRIMRRKANANGSPDKFGRRVTSSSLSGAAAAEAGPSSSAAAGAPPAASADSSAMLLSVLHELRSLSKQVQQLQQARDSVG